MSSNRVKVLKVLPPLLGGILNDSLKTVESVSRGTAGLQWRMKATYASSIVAAVTLRSGRDGRIGDARAETGPEPG